MSTHSVHTSELEQLSWTWRVFFALTLLVAVFLAFAPSLSAEFVSWDDDVNFTQNRAYRGLGLDNLAWMFTTFHMGHYQPLSWLTLGVDHALHGMNASGYHATNVFLHACTSIAVLFLARRLLSLARESNALDVGLASFAVAIVFGLHPLRVESVAWVTERRDVLAGFFFVLTISAWTRYATSNSRRAYICAIAFVVLSLLSKAAAIVMPALLVVLDVWPLRRVTLGWKRLVVEKVPFLAASVVFGWLAIQAQAAQGATLKSLATHGPIERVMQAAFGTAFYPWRTLVPQNLIPIHEIPEPFEPFSARFIVPFALVVVVTIVLWIARRRAPALLAAWVAYAITLAPVAGFTQAGPQLVADRYSYFAGLPFALLAGLAVVIALRASAARRVPIATLVLIVGTTLVWLTYRQTGYWRDSETLWRRNVAIAPNNSTGHLNLGSVLMRRGAVEDDAVKRERLLVEAEEHLTTSLALREHPQTHVNFGLIAMFRAQRDPTRAPAFAAEAVEHIRAGLRVGERVGILKPDWQLALGSALLTAGRCDEAAAVLQAVLPAMPATEAALRSTSLALNCVGRTAEALAVLERALALEPNDATLWMRAGDWNAKLGRVEEARVSYENVVALRAAARGEQTRDDEQWRSAKRALTDLN